MNNSIRRLAISVADRLAGSLLISINLHLIGQARRKLRRWRAAA